MPYLATTRLKDRKRAVCFDRYDAGLTVPFAMVRSIQIGGINEWARNTGGGRLHPW